MGRGLGQAGPLVPETQVSAPKTSVESGTRPLLFSTNTSVSGTANLKFCQKIKCRLTDTDYVYSRDQGAAVVNNLPPAAYRQRPGRELTPAMWLAER